MSFEDDVYSPNEAPEGTPVEDASTEQNQIEIESIEASKSQNLDFEQTMDQDPAPTLEHGLENASVYSVEPAAELAQQNFDFFDQNVHTITNSEGHGTGFSIEGGALISIRHVVDNSAVVTSDDHSGWSEQISKNEAETSFLDNGYEIIEASRNGTLDRLIVIDQNPEHQLGVEGLHVAEAGAPLHEGDVATIYHNRHGYTEAISATVTDAGKGLIVVDLQGEVQGDHFSGASGAPLVINGEVRGVVVASQVNHETGSTQIVAIAISKTDDQINVDYSQNVGDVTSELYVDELQQISDQYNVDDADGRPVNTGIDGYEGVYDLTAINNFKSDPENPEFRQALEEQVDTRLNASSLWELVEGKTIASSNEGIAGKTAEVSYFTGVSGTRNTFDKIELTIQAVDDGLIKAEVSGDLSTEMVGELDIKSRIDIAKPPLIIDGKVHGYIVDVKPGDTPGTTQLIAVAVVDAGNGNFKFDPSADDGQSEIEISDDKNPELLFIEHFHKPPMTPEAALAAEMAAAASTDAEASTANSLLAGDLAKNDPTMKWFTIDGTSMTSVEAARMYSREVFGPAEPEKEENVVIGEEGLLTETEIPEGVLEEATNGDTPAHQNRTDAPDHDQPGNQTGNAQSQNQRRSGSTSQQPKLDVDSITVTAHQRIEPLEIEEVVVTGRGYSRNQDGSLTFRGTAQYAIDEASYQLRHRAQDVVQGISDIGNGIGNVVSAVAEGTADDAVVDAVRGISDVISNYDSLSSEAKEKINLALVELGVGMTGVGGAALDLNTLLAGQNLDGTKASPADITLALGSLALTAVGAQQVKALIKAAGAISDIAHEARVVENVVDVAADTNRVVNNGTNVVVDTNRVVNNGTNVVVDTNRVVNNGAEAGTIVSRTDLPSVNTHVNDNIPHVGVQPNLATGTDGLPHVNINLNSADRGLRVVNNTFGNNITTPSVNSSGGVTPSTGSLINSHFNGPQHGSQYTNTQNGPNTNTSGELNHAVDETNLHETNINDDNLLTGTEAPSIENTHHPTHVDNQPIYMTNNQNAVKTMLLNPGSVVRTGNEMPELGQYYQRFSSSSKGTGQEIAHYSNGEPIPTSMSPSQSLYAARVDADGLDLDMANRGQHSYGLVAFGGKVDHESAIIRRDSNPEYDGTAAVDDYELRLPTAEEDFGKNISWLSIRNTADADLAYESTGKQLLELARDHDVLDALVTGNTGATGQFYREIENALSIPEQGEFMLSLEPKYIELKRVFDKYIDPNLKPEIKASQD